MAPPTKHDDGEKPGPESEIRTACHDILNVMTVLCGVQDELQQLVVLDPEFRKPLDSLTVSLQRLQAIANRLNRLKIQDARSKTAD